MKPSAIEQKLASLHKIMRPGYMSITRIDAMTLERG